MSEALTEREILEVQAVAFLVPLCADLTVEAEHLVPRVASRHTADRSPGATRRE
jgi:hypothetical protein